jgi:hypothetical protein
MEPQLRLHICNIEAFLKSHERMNVRWGIMSLELKGKYARQGYRYLQPHRQEGAEGKLSGAYTAVWNMSYPFPTLSHPPQICSLPIRSVSAPEHVPQKREWRSSIHFSHPWVIGNPPPGLLQDPSESLRSPSFDYIIPIYRGLLITSDF